MNRIRIWVPNVAAAACWLLAAGASAQPLPVPAPAPPLPQVKPAPSVSPMPPETVIWTSCELAVSYP